MGHIPGSLHTPRNRRGALAFVLGSALCPQVSSSIALAEGLAIGKGLAAVVCSANNDQRLQHSAHQPDSAGPPAWSAC